MTIESSVALAAAMFVFALIPGPGVMALVGRTLSRGRGAGLVWAAGTIVGDFAYLLLAIYGLGFVAAKLSGLFYVIRILGAAYLIWLGIQSFRHANDPMPEMDNSGASRGRGFLGGMCVSLGNPKVIGFYCGFLPTFMDLSALTVSDVASVCALVLCTVYTVLAGYVLAANSGRSVFMGSRFRRWFNRGAGSIMITSGVAVAAE